MAVCRGCPGTSCGCAVVAGSGTKVTGTGSANDPFKIAVDASALSISTSIAVASSATVELSKTGTGGVGDPVILIGDVIVRSPNNTRWTIRVSDTGALSATAAGAPRSGAGSASGGGDGGGTTVLLGTDILYWDGTSWPVRTSAQHVMWMSLGFTAVPVPAGFHAGDTWICEGT